VYLCVSVVRFSEAIVNHGDTENTEVHRESQRVRNGNGQKGDNMSPDDEQWSRWLRLRTADAEFPHAVIERRAIHTEASGSATWPTDNPTRFTEHTKNVIAFN
jgi:hypothetical protein